ncbi:hypothetical protein EJ04DRAFT_244037 [Polyplosphaeria fusca]|uniref:Secreted protein n=1 Tax=Polyplosphaeria fusca TaxID=682080 RepID=A0A9P4R028_9PLEO|nr:hypothetical protein EJ04DRAFT_244037 [Polyplosphaeria fusca]
MRSRCGRWGRVGGALLAAGCCWEGRCLSIMQAEPWRGGRNTTARLKCNDDGAFPSPRSPLHADTGPQGAPTGARAFAGQSQAARSQGNGRRGLHWQSAAQVARGSEIPDAIGRRNSAHCWPLVLGAGGVITCCSHVAAAPGPWLSLSSQPPTNSLRVAAPRLHSVSQLPRVASRLPLLLRLFYLCPDLCPVSVLRHDSLPQFLPQATPSPGQHRRSRSAVATQGPLAAESALSRVLASSLLLSHHLPRRHRPSADQTRRLPSVAAALLPLQSAPAACTWLPRACWPSLHLVCRLRLKAQWALGSAESPCSRA